MSSKNVAHMDSHRREAHEKSDEALAGFLRRHLQGANFSTWTQANIVELIERLEAR